jgi:Fe-S-cluster containining protein
MSRSENAWYRDGLAFECTRCGACCTGAPGYVWVDEAQIARLAEFVGLTPEQFSRRYVRLVGDALSLIERPGGDCVFWDRKAGCTVYPARPEQCRTWPFWPENIDTPADWERVKAGCPGAGRGPVISPEEILSAARRSPA